MNFFLQDLKECLSSIAQRRLQIQQSSSNQFAALAGPSRADGSDEADELLKDLEDADDDEAEDIMVGRAKKPAGRGKKTKKGRSNRGRGGR